MSRRSSALALIAELKALPNDDWDEPGDQRGPPAGIGDRPIFEDSDTLVELIGEIIERESSCEARVSVIRLCNKLEAFKNFHAFDETLQIARAARKAARDSLREQLEALVALDDATAVLGLQYGVMYRENEEVQRVLMSTFGILQACSVDKDSCRSAIEKSLSGSSDVAKARREWVFSLLSEREMPFHIVLGGNDLQYDRDTGGGARLGVKSARAAIARELNEVMPAFARNRWASQSRLLELSGIDIDSKAIMEAVRGRNRGG